MALIKCPECGKEVSNNAKACPNCGCSLKTSSTHFSLVLVGCVISVLIVLLSLVTLINNFDYIMNGSGSIDKLLEISTPTIIIMAGGLLPLISSVLQTVNRQRKSKGLNTASMILSAVSFVFAGLLIMTRETTWIMVVPLMMVPPILLLIAGNSAAKNL